MLCLLFTLLITAFTLLSSIRTPFLKTKKSNLILLSALYFLDSNLVQITLGFGNPSTTHVMWISSPIKLLKIVCSNATLGTSNWLRYYMLRFLFNKTHIQQKVQFPWMFHWNHYQQQSHTGKPQHQQTWLTWSIVLLQKHQYLVMLC